MKDFGDIMNTLLGQFFSMELLAHEPFLIDGPITKTPGTSDIKHDI